MLESYAWHNIVGNIGVFLIVGSYLLIQLGKLSGRSIKFSLANGLGAALVLVSLYFEFNLSAFVIELFWLIISLIGIVLELRRRRLGQPAEAVAGHTGL